MLLRTLRASSGATSETCPRESSPTTPFTRLAAVPVCLSPFTSWIATGFDQNTGAILLSEPHETSPSLPPRLVLAGAGLRSGGWVVDGSYSRCDQARLGCRRNRSDDS